MELLVSVVMVVGRSLMKMRNSSGPNTEPCGTPDRTGNQAECRVRVELMVRICLSHRNDCTNRNSDVRRAGEREELLCSMR